MTFIIKITKDNRRMMFKVDKNFEKVFRCDKSLILLNNAFKVREWREFDHLSELQCLEDLVFIGNPLEEEATLNGNYTEQVAKRLLKLMKLDGYPIIRDEEGEGDDDGLEEEDSDDSDVEGALKVQD